MKKTFLAVLLGAAFPVATLAQQFSASASGQTYVTGRLGLVSPRHEDLDGFDQGFAVEVAIGQRVAPNFAIEGSLGRFAMSGSQTVFDPFFGVVDVKADLAATSLLATVKAIAPIERIELYGLVGGGLYFVSMDGKVAQGGATLGSDSDSGSSFGLHLGGGLSANLTPNVTGGLEVKYVIGSVTLFDEKGHFDSLLATAQLGFRF